MPIRVTHNTVVVHRNGKNVHLKPGTRHDFTQEEIDQITKSHATALRRPINETKPVSEVTSEDDLVEDDANTETQPAPRRTATAKRPAVKTAPVEPEDDEL